MPRTSFLRFGQVAAVLCAVWVGWNDFATAQFQSDPVAQIDAREVRQLQGRVRKILRGSDSFDQQVFNQWYGQLFLPAMTSPKPADLAKLADRRRDLLKELTMAVDNPTAHKALVDLIYSKAISVEGGNYHPSVQYSFVYLLGELNDEEPKISERRPPVPHAAAFPVLLKMVDKPKQSDAVRVAALLGIRRQIQLRIQFPAVSGELSAGEKASATTLLSAVVDAQDPPQGRTRVGHDWMRSLAAESLGFLGDPGTAVTLAKLVAQSEASLSARCAAAKALGQLDLSQSSVGPAKLVPPFARLAADCCAAEQQTLANLVAGDDSIGRGVEGRLAETESFFGENAKTTTDGPTFNDPRSVPTRRRLLDYLWDIRAGLSGADGKSGLAKFAGNSATPLVQQVDATIATLRETTTNIVDLNVAIGKQAEQFQQLGGAADTTATVDKTAKN